MTLMRVAIRVFGEDNPDLFEIVAAEVPERLALVAGDTRLTYRELDEQADRFAGAVDGFGVRAGDPVGIFATNSGEVVVRSIGSDLHMDYTAVGQTTHVAARMEQMALPGSRTNPDLVAARFLLKPGRKYEQAVKAFEPYDSVKEENLEARAAGRALIAEGTAAGPKHLSRKSSTMASTRLAAPMSQRTRPAT